MYIFLHKLKKNSAYLDENEENILKFPFVEELLKPVLSENKWNCCFQDCIYPQLVFQVWNVVSTSVSSYI